MSDPNESQLISIEDPYPGDPPAEKAQEDEAEPEGVVEVAPGRRMVDVSVVAAERKRARELAEKTIREKELAPLQEKASRAEALQQALDTVKPHIEQLRQQIAQQQPRQPQEPQVSDAEAEQEARDLQLYDKDSKLDVATARKIITRRRTEAEAAARAAAHEAVTPFAKNTAEHASRQNFAEMAHMKGPDGLPLVDPEILAKEWVSLDPELTARREVAEVVLERAIGKSLRLGKARPVVKQAESGRPLLSEAPGGDSQQEVRLTDSARKMGLTQQDLKASQKTYNPGGVSEIGSW